MTKKCRIDTNAAPMRAFPENFTPKNNRKYNPSIKQCMKSFFIFFRTLEKSVVGNENWNIRSLFQKSLNKFLISYLEETWEDFHQEKLKLVKIKGNVNYNSFGVVQYNEGSMVINRNELIKLYNAFQVLKQDLFDWTEINEIDPEVNDADLPINLEPDTDVHFYLCGEERMITSQLLPDEQGLTLNEEGIITTEIVMGLSSTNVPEKHFIRSSIAATKGIEDDFVTNNGLKIRTDLKLSFLVKPMSNFSWKLLNINENTPIRKCTSEILDPIFVVPTLFNGGFSTFTELVQSLFVQYFVGFEDFQAVTYCDVCNSLMLRKKDIPERNTSDENEEKSIRHYCSTKCSNSDPTIKKKERKKVYNCRNRQKQVFEKKIGSTIPLYADYCIKCTIKLEDLPPGGECPYLLKDYEMKSDIFKNLRK